MNTFISNYKQSFYKQLVYLMFAGMLLVPTELIHIRGFLLLIILIGAVYIICTSGFYLHKQVVLISIFCFTVSLYSLVIGLVNSNPGLLSVWKLFLLWPIIYLLLISIIKNNLIALTLFKIIILAAAFAVMLQMASLSVGFLGYETQAENALRIFGVEIGPYLQSIEYSANNLNTVIYAFPFLLTLFLMRNINILDTKIWDGLIAIVLIMTFVSCILSGRRAFWLLILISPFYYYLIVYFVEMDKNKIKSLITTFILVCIVCLVVIIIANYSIRVEIIPGMLEKHFPVRYEQIYGLLLSWYDSPIFGNGLGAVASEYIRNPGAPWEYELTYLSLLQQVGLMGLAVYLLSVIWLVITSVKIMRVNEKSRVYLYPTIVAMLGYLTINATNPYLMKFDYLWVLFLPLALVNYYFYEQRNRYSNSQLEFR
jgi:hypothetical protein